jgi:thioredoxin-like negative regulator of GroEL
MIQANMAAALLALNDLPESEIAARRAVDLDASNLRGRYMLALALYAQQKFTDETVDQLGRVRDVFPNARIVLAVVLANRGQKDGAIAQLHDYLKIEKATKKDEAQKMLAALNGSGLRAVS